LRPHERRCARRRRPFASRGPCWAGWLAVCAGGRLSFVVHRFPIQLSVSPQKAH